MKTVLYSIILIVSVILQLLLAKWIAIGEIAPDFTILALAFTALMFARNTTTIMAFGVGLLRDGVGYSAPGIGALVFTLVGFIAGTLIYKRSFQKKYEVVLFFSILVFLYFLIYHVFLNALTDTFWQQFITDLLPRFLYTLLILVLTLFIVPERGWNTQK